jgi:ankyrin repeat protein
MRTLAAVLLLAALPVTAADLFTAIRNGDVRAVKAHMREAANKDAPNAEGLTPLMYAVLAAGPPVLRALIDGGANVNAAGPDGVTALHMAAYDLEKTRLLLTRGANPNAALKNGVTPLLIAADRPGTSEVVALLLAKSAVPDPKATAETALSRAARNADVALMRLLLARGVKISDTPRLARSAAAGHCRECLRIALAGGADANGATSAGRSALQDAAAFGDLEMVRMLVEKGANVSAADKRGYTALMRAALSYEPGAPQVVEYLLARGANVSMKNETGDTALSFAARSGETPIVAMLRKAGTPEPKTAVRVPAPVENNTPAEAIARSLPLLQRIGEPVRKLDRCTTCHNHTLPIMVVEMARARGVRVDEAVAGKELQAASEVDPQMLSTTLLGIGIPDFFAFQLAGLPARAESSSAIERMVHYVSTRQEPSGRFRVMDYRPPQEYTDITFTATALRALQQHTTPARAAEFKERVRRAARWLAAQTPRDTEDSALRLMGLAWAGASKSTKEAAVNGLLALQRPDGGWAQTAAVVAPDAYATGEALYALHLAGVSPTHPAYRRGVDFLLKTQRKDGSWFVASRSHPVQPLIDGGYPYINHQWISAAGGAWSTMALLATLPAQTAAR